MGKGKRVILALLAAATLAGHGVVVAEKGAVAPNPTAIPNVNLGLSAIPNFRTTVGLPAVAMPARIGPEATAFAISGPGNSASKGASAQTDAPGAKRSASSAGLTPPGQSKQSNRDASDDNKSSEAKEKLAALTGTATDAASGPAASLDHLPTCR